VLAVHLRPGDRVAVENPGYAALFHLLRALGLVLEPVPVDDRGMLPEELGRALAAGARAVIITPRGQNPTGAALDRERALRLRAVLDRAPHALLVEDDHLGAIAGSPLHTTVGGRERWAATRSVAKALGPDLRLAVLAGDSRTLARVQGRQRCGPGWVSHILQTLVHALWSDPAVSAVVARASETYARRRERLLAELARVGVDAHGACGLNVWVPVPEEAPVLAALLQSGWAVAPGEPFRLGDSPPAIRITTAALREADARPLAGALAEALAPSRVTRSG
jgi:DNA-binding transcriptional MocR family regulator